MTFAHEDIVAFPLTNNKESRLPEYEESPFTIKGFLSTSYETKDENLTYRLGFIQGTDKANIREYCKELNRIFEYVQKEMHNVALLEFYGNTGALDTHSVGIKDTQDIKEAIFEATHDHNAVANFEILVQEGLLDLKIEDYSILLQRILHLYKVSCTCTKALILNVKTYTDYLACLYLSLFKVDVLVINTADYMVNIPVGQVTDNPYMFSVLQNIKDIKHYLPTEDIEMVYSTAYTAEKAVIDKYNTELNIDKDIEHKVIFAKTTYTEAISLAGTSYKGKQDYLGIGNTGAVTYLPTLFVNLRGDFCNSISSLKANYKALFRKASFIYKNGTGLEDNMLETIKLLTESEYVYNGTKKAHTYEQFANNLIYKQKEETYQYLSRLLQVENSISSDVANYLVKQLKTMLNSNIFYLSSTDANSIDLAVIIAALLALPKELISYLQTRTYTSQTPVIIFYKDTDMSSETLLLDKVYLTVLAFLGFDVFCIDPHLSLDLAKVLKTPVYNTCLGNEVPDKFKYKYRRPLFSK